MSNRSRRGLSLRPGSDKTSDRALCWQPWRAVHSRVLQDSIISLSAKIKLHLSSERMIKETHQRANQFRVVDGGALSEQPLVPTATHTHRHTCTEAHTGTHRHTHVHNLSIKHPQKCRGKSEGWGARTATSTPQSIRNGGPGLDLNQLRSFLEARRGLRWGRGQSPNSKT